MYNNHSSIIIRVDERYPRVHLTTYLSSYCSYSLWQIINLPMRHLVYKRGSTRLAIGVYTHSSCLQHTGANNSKYFSCPKLTLFERNTLMSGRVYMYITYPYSPLQVFQHTGANIHPFKLTPQFSIMIYLVYCLALSQWSSIQKIN